MIKPPTSPWSGTPNKPRPRPQAPHDDKHPWIPSSSSSSPREEEPARKSRPPLLGWINAVVGIVIPFRGSRWMAFFGVALVGLRRRYLLSSLTIPALAGYLSLARLPRSYWIGSDSSQNEQTQYWTKVSWRVVKVGVRASLSGMSIIFLQELFCVNDDKP